MTGGGDLSSGDFRGGEVGGGQEETPRRSGRRLGSVERIPIGDPATVATGAPDDSAPGAPGSAHLPPGQPPERDPLGKMALYSSERRNPPLGSLLIECSACRRETPVSPVDLVRAGLPISVHLFLIRRYPSFMRCPACGRRTWVRIRWRL
jgi:hypothetical protein